MSSAFCTNCGEPVTSAQKFCGNCGQRLSKHAQLKATPFIVSPSKLAILSVVTGGVYDIYWLYRQWQHIKLRDSLSVKPFWRAVFYIFFTYSLFKRLQLPKAGGYTISYIGLTLIGLIPLDNYFIFLSLLAFLPLYSVLLVPCKPCFQIFIM